MAAPVADLYTAASGADVYAGLSNPNPPSNPREALLNQLAAAAPNTWVKANTNTFQSAWVPDDFRSLYLNSFPQSPSRIILAWSGFAWDNARDRLILFGGGHANTNENSVYMWNAATRQWSIAFYPSDIIESAPQRPVDGYANAPTSAHPYANQVYLPTRNRYVTFGGGSQPGGSPWAFYDIATGALQRYIGCYTLDMSQAGTGKVGGTTGSNPHRGSSAGVNLPGAQAWKVRDWALDHPQAATVVPRMVDHIDAWADVVQENGRDVIYLQAGAPGQTNFGAFRVEFVDDDYHHDLISQVGRWVTGRGRCPSGCVDTARRLLLYPGYTTLPLCGWNLATASATNDNFAVPTAGFSGAAAATLDAAVNSNSGDGVALLYDASRNRTVAFTWAGDVLDIRAPASGPLTSGWTVTKLADANRTVRPQLPAEMGVDGITSINGKWRYARSLDVYMMLTHNLNGDLWLFKPAGWVDPR